MKASKLTKETILNIDTDKTKLPKFGVGDTIEVALIVKEGSKERIQMFAGDVIAMKQNGISSTFTVRRLGANSIWVEKIFPYHSPIIDKIKIIKRGDVRRAKLYYIRKRIGKATRIKEKIKTKTKEERKTTTDE